MGYNGHMDKLLLIVPVLGCSFLSPFLSASAPKRFTPADAVRSEWERRPPPFTEAERNALPEADRERLDLARRRIGAPGDPPLLPPELEKPLREAWESKALSARSPLERFTALHFLNRLGSDRALSALAGLGPEDALAWPRHLHLEFPLAAARLRGESVKPELAAFLEALGRAGKSDPVRAAAARLRLVLAGVESELLPPLEPDPGAVLALLETWNRSPWEKRREVHLQLLDAVQSGDPGRVAAAPWTALGLLRAPLEAGGDFPLRPTLLIRLLEGLPDPAPEVSLSCDLPSGSGARPVQLAQLGALLRFPVGDAARRELAKLSPRLSAADPLLRAALLPVLRRFDPAAADRLRSALLAGRDPLGRAAAIEDLPAPPVDLDEVERRAWKDAEFDSAQALFSALKRWSLPAEKRRDRLQRWLRHPNWSRRYDAWQALREIAPETPWPAAPAPTREERRILKLARRLAETGKPVRLRLEFASGRHVTLRLDAARAPINTANLLRLASRGFFDNRRVPRVVPDFVVQMGSPLDTMDGGPGYTVRCENSLDGYGPGSVGMALAGKDTGGSQFFITLNATPHLTGKYTRLGEVENPDEALRLLDNFSLTETIRRVRRLD